ncbi:hypothetical protein BCR32DRAFT_293101 [Anaeromyces robustus]|uniref:Actin depolymerizing protein n=1 Tax=Anaeromyces robustus TaxID=1754192 RepID=A0A1Y1X7I8_9FUNG|nr:hypothetical protein BCR32DRAFT_293101 [Anaeromyces robustus]|eukprot:ORX81727.1 hypothetical protein BCR32DRAFT_293101 [Anaeromyces robustus]
MSTVSFSANGKEIRNAYDSILSGESSFEWALYGYEDGSNEIELVDSGIGLEKLCDEFDEEEYQYAFARVTDPNSKLPRFVFISWCGESVPFTKKGMYNTFTNDVLKYFSGFHIHINARSKFDVDPDEILKKVKSCSGANYSFHQNQSVKNKAFNNTPGKLEPKIELKAEENKAPAKPNLFNQSSAPKVNPINQNSAPKVNPINQNSAPKVNPLNNTTDEKSSSTSMSRRSSNVDYNPLEPNASRKNSLHKSESRGSVENIRAAFENMGNQEQNQNKKEEVKVSSGKISDRIAAFKNLENQESKQEVPKPSAKKIPTFKPVHPEPVREVPKPVQPEPVREVPKPVQPEPVREVPKPVQPEPVREVPKPVQQEPVREVPKPIQPEPVEEPVKQQKTSNEGNTVKALYAYEAQEDGELSFDENEILTNVVDVPGDGWWSGNNSNGDYGMFPANYVTSDLNETAEEEEVEEKSEKPALENDEKNVTAKAMYSYEAQDETEISFEEGETITHIIIQDENWGIGFNSNNQQGMFPLNYVELNQ